MIYEESLKGISLVEIIIAIGLFAFAVVPLITIFTTSIDTFKAIREYITIIHVTEGQLHKYVNIINNLQTTENINLIDEDITSEVIGENADKLSFFHDLKIVATVRTSPITGGFGSYEINIRANWAKDRNYSIFTTVPMRTFIAKSEAIERPKVNPPKPPGVVTSQGGQSPK